jgi:hypothetical protein
VIHRPKVDKLAINSRMVDLLEDERLFAQIVGLERRTARGGRDSIDHPPGARDDLANSVAGVVASLASSAHEYYNSMDWVSGPQLGQGLSLWQHPYFNGGRSRW